ncbi:MULTISPECIES: response regulator transcription factor [Bradyrhizobium]|uniref:response regulator transcription factor n=1 Tax=Bradyrhizobium elkanii TaxID=29448 RepID=UPI0004826C28|nr:response regulator transcription factor [Bradyrhizobium elkanii]
MYVIIDDRENVATGYIGGFDREGISSVGFSPTEFLEWLESAGDDELSAIDAFLLGDCDTRATLPRTVRKRCRAPIIALSNQRMLKHTVELFEAGVDDVVHIPVHPREILARTAAISRRSLGISTHGRQGAIRVFFDGRDPEIGGAVMMLPRRELRILEHMVGQQGKWLTKTQIFNAVYGIFESTFDENVIESHVSKLRKKLRDRLGYDPIVSRRYSGYRLDSSTGAPEDDATRDLQTLGILAKQAPSRPRPIFT